MADGYFTDIANANRHAFVGSDYDVRNVVNISNQPDAADAPDWFAGRLPDAWFTEDPEVVVDRVLSALGLIALVYGFTEAAKSKHLSKPNDTSVQGWTSPTTITYLLVAVILLAVFVIWERRTEHPLLPLRIVLDRNRGGAYLAILGRTDVVSFTAGVGENAAAVRLDALDGLQGLGIEIDEERNSQPAKGARRISTDASAIAVLVVPTNEELAIARDCMRAI